MWNPYSLLEMFLTYQCFTEVSMGAWTVDTKDRKVVLFFALRTPDFGWNELTSNVIKKIYETHTMKLKWALCYTCVYFNEDSKRILCINSTHEYQIIQRRKISENKGMGKWKLWIFTILHKLDPVTHLVQLHDNI